ncbi:Pre-mRNA-splicing factor cwc26 [Lithohypha guttulata]|uniref:Pre-mRNA-splicing factor cwc26 n=1 Tax=Lithohypha guttulata TaxID=1690604 RepID=A0AAN7SU48_9EURO|nr:Pre-mRNA-splicing factor cwc26 [Lithohypha guttulata]
MPASAAYLTKYLTASSTKSSPNADFEDPSRPKKRRKKDKHHATSTTEPSTLLIADDDADLLLSNQKSRGQDDEEDGPTMFDNGVRSAEFRKKKNSAWKTVQDRDVDVPLESADTEADRILAAAAQESDSRRIAEQDDEAPAVVEDAMISPDPTTTTSGPKMSSGAKAGLQTAADTAIILAAEQAREADEARALKKQKKRAGNQKDGQSDQPAAALAPEDETIYRDATGRRIDISLARQQARAAEVAKLQAEKKEREAAMGDVQLRQREQAKQDLDEAKFLTLGRSADDEELNERQKEEVRWDDPMAQYIAERRAEKDAEEEERNPRAKRRGRRDLEGVEVVKVRKREYQGPAPPNRYGIKPGWRWDGVDRGCGFEKEWFQARGKKTRNENLEYQWAMDE